MNPNQNQGYPGQPGINQQFGQQPGMNQQFGQQQPGMNHQFGQQPGMNQQFGQQPGFAPRNYRQPVIVVGDPVSANKKRSKNLAIISLVSGILSIVFCFFFYVGIILGISGLIEGFVSLGQHRDGRSLAIGGTITSGIGSVLSILSFCIWLILL